MSQRPSSETTLDITKLPKWAQVYIVEIERQRDTAVDKLKSYVDNQTKSPIFVEELVCLGPGSPTLVKRYINDTQDVTFSLNPVAGERESKISVRFDHFDPTQLKITAAWDGLQISPEASNVISIRTKQ